MDPENSISSCDGAFLRLEDMVNRASSLYFRTMVEEALKSRVLWIGVRPARKAPLVSLQQVQAQEGIGLEGDHYNSPGGKRQVTLIRQEDMAAAASLLGIPAMDPGLARRNLVISGLQFPVPRGVVLRVGECLLEVTGPCHPCERMDDNFGRGGTKALAGRGGLTARILQGGTICVGDGVCTES